MSLPNPPELTITGPFWTAQATVLSGSLIDDEQDALHMRNIYVDFPQSENGTDLLLAGTMRVLCYVDQVTLHPEPTVVYRWQRSGDQMVPAASRADELESGIAGGQLALLVLSTDPTVEADDPDKTRRAEDSFDPRREQETAERPEAASAANA